MDGLRLNFVCGCFFFVFFFSQPTTTRQRIQRWPNWWRSLLRVACSSKVSYIISIAHSRTQVFMKVEMRERTHYTDADTLTHAETHSYCDSLVTFCYQKVTRVIVKLLLSATLCIFFYSLTIILFIYLVLVKILHFLWAISSHFILIPLYLISSSMGPLWPQPMNIFDDGLYFM